MCGEKIFVAIYVKKVKKELIKETSGLIIRGLLNLYNSEHCCPIKLLKKEDFHLPSFFSKVGLLKLYSTMNTTIHFFGNSVFGQLISLIDSKIITDSSKSRNSDRYVKKYTTKDHLFIN
jgi:Domain of unknown function (DUF4372)